MSRIGKRTSRGNGKESGSMSVLEGRNGDETVAEIGMKGRGAGEATEEGSGKGTVKVTGDSFSPHPFSIARQFFLSSLFTTCGW